MEGVKTDRSSVRTERINESVVGVPLRVLKKFGDDQAGTSPRAISYYGFLLAVPLMLVLVDRASGWSSGQPRSPGGIQSSALANFPVIGPEYRPQRARAGGSGVTVAIGVALALWPGSAC